MEVEEFIGADDRCRLAPSKDCVGENPLDVPQSRVDNGFGSLIVEVPLGDNQRLELGQWHALLIGDSVRHFGAVGCGEPQVVHELNRG